MIHNTKRRDAIDESAWAMPDGPGSHAPHGTNLRCCRRSGFDPYRGGPSPEFVSLTRNPSLEPPERFEPTVKGCDDVVI